MFRCGTVSIKAPVATVLFWKFQRGMRQVPQTLPGPIVLSILLPASGRLGLLDLSVQAAACGMFIETYPTQRSANMHIAKPYRHHSAGRPAWVSRPLLLKPRPLTQAGGSGAAGLIPDLRHQSQSYFLWKKVGVGINMEYICRWWLMYVFTLP